MATMTVREILDEADDILVFIEEEDGEKAYEVKPGVKIVWCDEDNLEINKFTDVEIIRDAGDYAHIMTRSIGDPVSLNETLVVLR